MTTKEMWLKAYEEESKRFDPNSPMFSEHQVLLRVIDMLEERIHKLEEIHWGMK